MEFSFIYTLWLQYQISSKNNYSVVCISTCGLGGLFLHFNGLMFTLVGTNNYASVSQCCIHTSTFSLKYNSKKQRQQ